MSTNIRTSTNKIARKDSSSHIDLQSKVIEKTSKQQKQQKPVKVARAVSNHVKSNTTVQAINGFNKIEDKFFQTQQMLQRYIESIESQHTFSQLFMFEQNSVQERPEPTILNRINSNIIKNFQKLSLQRMRGCADQLRQGFVYVKNILISERTQFKRNCQQYKQSLLLELSKWSQNFKRKEMIPVKDIHQSQQRIKIAMNEVAIKQKEIYQANRQIYELKINLQRSQTQRKILQNKLYALEQQKTQKDTQKSVYNSKLHVKNEMLLQQIKNLVQQNDGLKQQRFDMQQRIVFLELEMQKKLKKSQIKPFEATPQIIQQYLQIISKLSQQNQQLRQQVEQIKFDSNQALQNYEYFKTMQKSIQVKESQAEVQIKQISNQKMQIRRKQAQLQKQKEAIAASQSRLAKKEAMMEEMERIQQQEISRIRKLQTQLQRSKIELNRKMEELDRKEKILAQWQASQQQTFGTLQLNRTPNFKKQLQGSKRDQTSRQKRGQQSRQKNQEEAIAHSFGKKLNRSNKYLTQMPQKTIQMQRSKKTQQSIHNLNYQKQSLNDYIGRFQQNLYRRKYSPTVSNTLRSNTNQQRSSNEQIRSNLGYRNQKPFNQSSASHLSAPRKYIQSPHKNISRNANLSSNKLGNWRPLQNNRQNSQILGLDAKLNRLRSQIRKELDTLQ